jgi:molybdopterin molybdotransferase
MLSREEALELLLEGKCPVGIETVPIALSGGRVLARDIIASRSQPPDRLSAMDGYAARGPLAEGDVLKVIGEAPAGKPFEGSVEAGTAVRIATGGVVPAGADRVVVQEAVERAADRVRLIETPGEARFVRAAGSDFEAGRTVARAGDPLTPARLGLVAAANHGHLTVYRRPRVAVLASGDELREPGETLVPGQVVNSAPYTLSRLLEQWGGIAVQHPILADDDELARRQIDGADLDVDLIIPLGGASVGDRDRLRPLFEERGARILFDKVAVRPGKPTWHARLDGPPLLGLPGNPASAFVCAHLFVRPLLFALAGRRAPVMPFLHARLMHGAGAGGAREAFLRAKAFVDEQGQLQVTADARQDSGLQSPLAAANALLRRPANAPAGRRGQTAQILLTGEIEGYGR